MMMLTVRRVFTQGTPPASPYGRQGRFIMKGGKKQGVFSGSWAKAALAAVMMMLAVQTGFPSVCFAETTYEIIEIPDPESLDWTSVAVEGDTVLIGTITEEDKEDTYKAKLHAYHIPSKTMKFVKEFVGKSISDLITFPVFGGSGNSIISSITAQGISLYLYRNGTLTRLNNEVILWSSSCNAYNGTHAYDNYGYGGAIMWRERSSPGGIICDTHIKCAETSTYTIYYMNKNAEIKKLRSFSGTRDCQGITSGDFTNEKLLSSIVTGPFNGETSVFEFFLNSEFYININGTDYPNVGSGTYLVEQDGEVYRITGVLHK